MKRYILTSRLALKTSLIIRWHVANPTPTFYLAKKIWLLKRMAFIITLRYSNL